MFLKLNRIDLLYMLQDCLLHTSALLLRPHYKHYKPFLLIEEEGIQTKSGLVSIQNNYREQTITGGTSTSLLYTRCHVYTNDLALLQIKRPILTFKARLNESEIRANLWLKAGAIDYGLDKTNKKNLSTIIAKLGI